MSSLSKLLLVYDGTDEANAALTRCAQLSLALSAQVDVVSVVDSMGANATCAGMLSDLAFNRLAEHARQTLQSAVGKLTDDGVTVQGHLKFGRTVDVVYRHATVCNADIVVIGHRLHAGLSRWWRERPVHVDLAERLRGPAIVTVTLPLA